MRIVTCLLPLFLMLGCDTDKKSDPEGSASEASKANSDYKKHLFLSDSDFPSTPPKVKSYYEEAKSFGENFATGYQMQSPSYEDPKEEESLSGPDIKDYKRFVYGDVAVFELKGFELELTEEQKKFYESYSGKIDMVAVVRCPGEDLSYLLDISAEELEKRNENKLCKGDVQQNLAQTRMSVTSVSLSKDTQSISSTDSDSDQTIIIERKTKTEYNSITTEQSSDGGFCSTQYFADSAKEKDCVRKSISISKYLESQTKEPNSDVWENDPVYLETMNKQGGVNAYSNLNQKDLEYSLDSSKKFYTGGKIEGTEDGWDVQVDFSSKSYSVSKDGKSHSGKVE